MIYVVQDPHTKHVKIGHSDHPRSRIIGVQTGCSGKLKCLVLAHGGWLEEQFLHEKFKEYRLSGEWFKYVPEIKKYVEENYDRDKLEFFGLLPTGNDLQRLRKKHYRSLRYIANKLGITPPSVYEVETRYDRKTCSIQSIIDYAGALGYEVKVTFKKKK